MRLTKEQCEKLLRERGIWITEACDKCGKLLGAVHWTRRGEPGEWCSAECRDGVPTKSNVTTKQCLECGVPLNGKRSDSDFCSRTHLMRHRRKSQTAQNRENSGNTPIGKQGLTGAEKRGWTDTPSRTTEGLETALCPGSPSAETIQ
jgi:hypothetical protein